MTDFSPVAGFGLLLVRPAMLVMVAPGIGGAFVPPQAKVALAVFLALTLVSSVSLPSGPGPAGLAVMVGREILIGLSLGFVVRALIAAAELGGQLSAFQIGFSYAATVDPSTGVRNDLLATLYGMLAVLTFLGINGHHTLLRALSASYAGMPIGTGDIDGSILVAVRQILALVFTVGVRLAAPIVIVVLVVELAIGLISRTAPSLSAMVVGFPLRIVVGLALLAALISTIPAVIASVVERAVALALQAAAVFR